MKRAWYILAVAAALAWGAREAQALVVGVQASWENDTTHLNNGSIVQVVVYKDGTGRDLPSSTDGNYTDPSSYFEAYSSDVYLPNTVKAELGHELVYEGHVEVQDGKYVFKEYIDIDPQYDRIYIRVFEETGFAQGVPTGSWWGVSEAQTISPEAGLGFTWFEDVPMLASNIFEVIPEPGTACLLLCGLGGMACAGRRRKDGVKRSGKTGDGER